MSDDVRALENELDFEFWAERAGLRFKVTRGSSGMQLNFHECPNPECGDRRWRTYCNQETGRGNCFVCDHKFKGKIDFIMMSEQVKFRDAMSIVRDTLKDQGWKPKRKTVAVSEEKAKFPLSIELPTPDGETLQYLVDRGIDAEMAGYFHLRFCEFGSWRFTKDDQTQGSQNFANRVIIPVYDLDGEFMTFQGRDLKGTSEKKYLFPAGLPGTGRFLLNGQNAVRSKRVVMGEGFFDVAAIKIAFDDTPDLREVVPVGSFGKHLSFGSIDGNDQLGRFHQLKAYGLEEVTVMWDGEPKALVSALDAAELLHKIGLRVRIALLPPDKDPNEVPAQAVRDAFYKAALYTRQLAVKWRLRNPYVSPKSQVIFDCRSVA